MNGKLTLDSFVTTLACLTTYNEPGQLPFTPRTADLSTNHTMGCSPQAIGTLNTQVRELHEKDNDLELQITVLQQSLARIMPELKKLETQCANAVPSCIGKRSGYSTIKDADLGNFVVQCEEDLGEHGGNWLVIANREDGSAAFYNSWESYKDGFGELRHDYFIGLDKLHAFTTRALHELLIILTKRTGEQAYAHYDYFSIGSEREKYSLKLLGTYSGNAGDALSYHAGQKFTTYDSDNDANELENCARKHTGAWWYKNCMESNLFGTFQTFGERDILASKGILWKGFHDGPLGSIKTVKMYIRPRADNN